MTDLALVGRLVGACLVIALVLGGVQSVSVRLTRERRFRSGQNRPLMSLVETTFLPGAASLHVIRVAESYVVVGRTASSLTTLAKIPAAEVDRWRTAEDVPASRPSARLRQLFGRVERGR